MKIYLTLIIPFILFTLVQAQVPDTIIPKKGNIIMAKIVDTNDEAVFIINPKKDTLRIAKNQIKEIRQARTTSEQSKPKPEFNKPFSRNTLAVSLLGTSVGAGIEYHQTIAEGKKSLFNVAIGAGYAPIGISTGGTITFSLQVLGAHRFKEDSPHYMEYGITSTLGLFLPHVAAEDFQALSIGGLIGYRYQQEQGFFFRTYFNPSFLWLRGISNGGPWLWGGFSFGYSF